MKDFNSWFKDFSIEKKEKIVELPEGVWESDGKYIVRCCRCDQVGEIHCDISEIPQQDYEHYCGGSDRCIP